MQVERAVVKNIPLLRVQTCLIFTDLFCALGVTAIDKNKEMFSPYVRLLQLKYQLFFARVLAH
jgi:hypothetical protein